MTQSQFDTSDVTEDDNRGEEEDVDWKCHYQEKMRFVKLSKLYGHVNSFKMTERKWVRGREIARNVTDKKEAVISHYGRFRL